MLISALTGHVKGVRLNINNLLAQSLLLSLFLTSLTACNKPSSVLDTYSISDKSDEEKEVVTIFENIQSASFNEVGELSLLISATQLEEFEDGQQKLQDPIFTQLPETSRGNAQLLWRSTALTAYHNPETQLTKLLQQVQVKAKSSKIFSSSKEENNTPQAFLQLDTESLTIDHKKRISYNEQAVQIETHLGKMQAGSLRLDFNAESLELNSNVKAQFKPEVKAGLSPKPRADAR